MPVVRAGEDDVDVRQPTRRLEEVLNPLLRGDPADVEDDGGTRRNDLCKRIGVLRERRLREAVALCNV